ncbi:hypothetical protein [Rhizobium sp. BE258]|uniref:hypothetical protein n=1 Tax=Rhizobium sp. BE258 TaxID=2817722 RepID=UPI0028551D12|nr:hypothetical protein [Rhizobium sp. BE258]MDR7147057.1 hypothetical protein [Rhizobium sp. BE258]
MTLMATGGSKVFIGGVLASKNSDFVVADFSAVTWVEIGQLESIGTFGDTAAEITFDNIGLGRTQKLRGNKNAGNMELVMGIDAADAGQIALLAAFNTNYDYAFKVEFTDKPNTGASPKNSTRQFIGKVMSASEALDTANSVAKMTASIGVNSNVVRTAASAT